MPEKKTYPQIPATVWWGVRNILANSPSVTIDDRYLAVQLSVQPAAAKQYKAELMNVGILDQDGKATELAKKWRVDGTYADAVKELIESNYPQGLRNIAPVEEGDRQKAVAWFMHDGLGKGAASNKAATYMLIGAETPGDNLQKQAGNKNVKSNKSAKAKTDTPVRVQEFTQAKERQARSGNREFTAENNSFPLNVNLQIHIGADAGQEQIESIFAAMRRYLYDKQGA